MKRIKVLIIGASGSVGSHIYSFLKKKKIEVLGTYKHNKKKNLVKLDTSSIKFETKKFKNISHVIICQNSFKKLDEYEINWKKAEKLDYTLLKRFFLKLKDLNIIPIYISTDAVFDGSRGNYKENDEIKPLNKYGKVKKKMELFITNNFSKYIIIRLSKFFSSDRSHNDFLKDMIENIKKKRVVKYAVDEFFSPIHSYDLNRFLVKLIKSRFNGIIHLSSVKKVSRYNLALIIKSNTKSSCKVLKTKINSMNFLAKRGKNCTLNTNKFDKIYNIKKKKFFFKYELKNNKYS